LFGFVAALTLLLALPGPSAAEKGKGEGEIVTIEDPKPFDDCMAHFAVECDFVAVAFSGEYYTGASWVIHSAGDYDLGKGFNLPNDSISSIRIRPGYIVTLYEHSGFEGKWIGLGQDFPELKEPELPVDWQRSASSLRVEKDPAEDDDPAWMQNARDRGAPFFALNEASVATWKEDVHDLTQTYEPHWYGGRSDEERVKRAERMLDLFQMLGIDVSEWTPNSFAQQINNFYDWRKDMNLWQVACLIFDVDAAAYVK
jgi:hypothetical protein